MKRLLGIILFSCALPLCSMGQGMPAWIQSVPPQTETYYYRVSQGTGLTEEEALRQAFAKAVFESAFAIGVPVDLQKLERMNGDSLLVEASRYVKIPINKVCQYTEQLVTRRGYRAYVLCQVAGNAHVVPQFKSFNCITNREE